MEILYEDPRIVVAVKPAGVLSTDEPGGMPELLRTQLHTDCIRTVHRLDAQVAGIMVFARSRMAASLLSQQLRDHRFIKEYLAVLCGAPPRPVDTLADLLARDTQHRTTYVADVPSPDTREARLSYDTVDSAGGLTLVRVRLHTGRTHQIRVQFASRGFPLLGDGKYGSRDNRCTCALWSFRLTLPTGSRPQTFEALPPHQSPWTQFPLPEIM